MRNTLRLVEDFGTEAMFKTTMRPESELFNPSKPRQSQYHTNTIRDLDQVMLENEDNVFNKFISNTKVDTIDEIAAFKINSLNKPLWSPIVFETPKKLWSPVIFS